MSSQDEMIMAIQAFRKAANIAIVQEAKTHSDQIEDAKLIVEKGRAWIKESGIGVSACYLYEASKSWPHWIKREDWSNWNDLNVIEVEGSSSFKSSQVAFTYKEHKWKFAHTQHENYFDANRVSGILTISVDEVRVLELSVSKSLEEFSKWETVGIEGLIIGVWAADLVEMEILLERGVKNRMSQMQADRLKNQAAKIHL